MGWMHYEWVAWARAITGLLEAVKSHIVASTFAFLASIAAFPALKFIDPEVDLMEEFILLLGYSLIGPAVLLAALLLLFRARAGADLYDNAQAKIDELEARLQPRLRCTLPNGDGLTRIGFGTSTDSGNGKRQTVNSRNETYLCLHVTIDSEASACNMSANLVGAWTLDEDGNRLDLQFIESVQLLWSRESRNWNPYVYAGPGETKRLYIARVVPQGAVFIHRQPDDLPLEYHQIFSTPNRYLLKVQVIHDNGPAQNVEIQIETEATPPAVNRLPEVKGKAVIVE